MSRASMMQPRQNSTYQWEGRMKNVLAAVVLAVASLIGMNLTAGTDATVIPDPAFTVSIPELATMHVPKKYSRSAAIARMYPITSRFSSGLQLVLKSLVFDQAHPLLSVGMYRQGPCSFLSHSRSHMQPGYSSQQPCHYSQPQPGHSVASSHSRSFVSQCWRISVFSSCSFF